MSSMKWFYGCLLTPMLLFSQTVKMVKGKVTDGNQPLVGAHVFAKENKDLGTYTNNEGFYELQVQDDTVLIFSFQGMEEQTFKAGEIPTELNVALFPETNILDEVVLKKNQIRLREQKALFDAYNLEKEIVKTKYALLDKKISGYAIEVREGDQINFASNNILTVLQSLFAGIKVRLRGSPTINVQPDDPNAVIYMRGTGSIQNPREAIYDVDGTVYQDPPRFLDITNIKRIARIPGLGGTAVYGSLGAGGVFVINTKSANYSPTEKQLEFRAKQNSKTTYDLKALPYSREIDNSPKYLKDLLGVNAIEEAKTIYLNHKKVYSSNPYFVLDMVNHFNTKFKGNAFSVSLFDEAAQLEIDSYEYYRALAQIAKITNNVAAYKAVCLNKFKKWPHSPQSYLDLYYAYRLSGDALKALNFLQRYNLLTDQGDLTAETEWSHEIFVSEFEQLSKQLKNDVKNVSRDDKEGGTRIVLDWNDDQAALVFHFVDPNLNYFNWDNSIYEVAQGNTNFPLTPVSKEYFIPINSSKGKWKINVEYLGNTKMTPTFLNVRIYHNFGLATERVENKLFRLSLKNKLIELITINI